MDTTIESAKLPQIIELPTHDILSALAIDDPEAFENLRLEFINRVINSTTERNKTRLLGIQFQVDAIRTSSKSNTGSTVKVYQLMWDSLSNLNDAWNDFKKLKSRVNTPDSDDENKTLPAGAKILPFHN